MRPAVHIADNYELIYYFVYELFILGSLIVLLLIGIASILIKNTRYITFNTCLDYLPPRGISFPMEGIWFSIFPHCFLLVYSFSMDFYLRVTLSVTLQELFTIYVLRLLDFYRKIYFLTLLNFVYIYELLLPKSSPWVKVVFLWFLKLILLLSSDIETQPGPIPNNSRISVQERGFRDSFFSFCNWNLNTLSKNEFHRVSLLEAHNSFFKYDIISLCETSLNETTKVPENILKGYNFFSLDHPSGDKKGCVGIFYKETLPLKIRLDLSYEECLVCELNFGRKNIFFTVLYRNPINKSNSPEFTLFIQKFEDLYQNILKEKPYTVFFTGDFNAKSLSWWPEGESNDEGTQLDNLFAELNLTQIISEPTHLRENCQPTCIDLIITDQPNLVLDRGVRPSLDPTCKHQITFCKTNFSIPPPPPFSRKMWKYDQANTNLITRALSQFPWLERLNQFKDDPSSQVELLNETILNIMSNFVPNKVTTIKPSEPEWINRKIKNMLRKQNRIYKKYKRNGFREVDKIPLDLCRKECDEEIENSKQNYILKLGIKLADRTTGQKTYWKIVNNLLNKCKIPRIPPLLVANKFVTNCKEKATLFNNFFVAQCQPFDNASTLPVPKPLTHVKLDTFKITCDQISNHLIGLNANKAHGPDDISVSMIKLCGDSLVLPLNIIFNNILRTAKFPKQWKSANVTPVHKKENKQLIKNYRPISLLPIFAKVFEKIIFRHLYNHLVSNNLITSNQSGFRPGDSVTNQLIYLVHEILKNFNCNEHFETRSVYLDMSKAFDKVWHQGLIYKLEQNGVKGNLLEMFKSYLSEREQRVVMNGVYSDWGHLNSGVPQGSVLGPLLFLVYVNDLENGIKSSIKFFADDTSLFSIVQDPKISAEDLNYDLQLIAQWAFQWKMSFNPDPTKPAEEIVFSRKLNSHDHPPLYFNNSMVKRVNEHKHLGLTLDSKLTFANHITEKISKARKGVGVIKYLSSYVPVKTLDQIYKMYVRPHLDFCDVIYHIPEIESLFSSSIKLSYWMDQIERVQYQAALAVSGAWQGTNMDKIYEELGWESLSRRRWFRRLVQFFKIQNDPSTPRYLKSPIPRPLENPRTTRGGSKVPTIDAKRDYFKNSFYPNVIDSWNKLDSSLKQSASLSIFKSNTLKLIRPPKKSIFNIHDPKGIKRLFQLRVGLSPLREHKFRKNFKDTPTETCSCKMDAETTEHFFFHCVNYIEARNTMKEVINPILVSNNLLLPNDKMVGKFLLYGHEVLSTDENVSVLSATLKYIHDSMRFEPTK